MCCKRKFVYVNRPEALCVIKFKLRPDACTKTCTICLFALFRFPCLFFPFLLACSHLLSFPRVLSLSLSPHATYHSFMRLYATDILKTARKYRLRSAMNATRLKNRVIFFVRALLAVIIGKVYVANAIARSARGFDDRRRFYFIRFSATRDSLRDFMVLLVRCLYHDTIENTRRIFSTSK